MEDPGDPEGLPRMAESRIFDYQFQDSTDAFLPLSRYRRGAGVDGSDYTEARKLFGDLKRYAYLHEDRRRTASDVVRHYEQVLSENGWQILYSAQGRTEVHASFGMGTRLREPLEQSQIFENFNLDNFAYIAARRTDAGQEFHVAIVIMRHDLGLVGPYREVERGMMLTRVDLVESMNPETQGQVVSAAKLLEGLRRQGRVVLPAVRYESERSNFAEQPDAVSAEVAELLKTQPGLILAIVGHYDDGLDLAKGIDLSRRRAQAFVRELTVRHGVESRRVIADGVGALAPLSPNDSEVNRRRNQRLELVVLRR